MTSLVTRCPACGTLFKVVPDQLRISEGWVRCGQCDEVFDAQAHMQPPMELVPDDASVPPEVSASVSAEPDDQLPLAKPEPEFEGAAVKLEGREGSGSEVAVESPANEAAASEADAQLLDVVEEVPADPVFPMVDGVDPVEEAPSLRFIQGASVSDSMDDARPSFLKGSTVYPVQSRWRRSLKAATVLALAVALVAQVAVQQRARIAAAEPALASVLRALCSWDGCVIEPLRQIESVVIESSSFVKIKTDVYRLSFSIKNTALVPLALPFAELTLTDLRDQSVLRRVVSPIDYGARGEILAPGEELSLVVPVAVKATAGTSEKITGYRLLVFYP